MAISDQWLAGFFDGEGSVRLQRGFSKKSPNSVRAELKIANTNLALLEAIRAKHGGAIRVKRNPTRPCYTLYWSNVDDVKRMTACIGKHAVAKARILKLIAEYLAKRSSATRVHFTERDAEIFALVSSENRAARYIEAQKGV